MTDNYEAFGIRSNFNLTCNTYILLKKTCEIHILINNSTVLYSNVTTLIIWSLCTDITKYI